MDDEEVDIYDSVIETDKQGGDEDTDLFEDPVPKSDPRVKPAAPAAPAAASAVSAAPAASQTNAPVAAQTSQTQPQGYNPATQAHPHHYEDPAPQGYGAPRPAQIPQMRPAPPASDQPRPALSVSNMTWWTSENDILRLLSEAGIFEHMTVTIATNAKNGKSNGTAIVEFQTVEGRNRGKEKLETTKLYDTDLYVSIAPDVRPAIGAPQPRTQVPLPTPNAYNPIGANPVMPQGPQSFGISLHRMLFI